MEVLDHTVDQPTRWAVMEACGRRCIGASTLQKAFRLQQAAQGLDDLACKLNATYDRGYCGSVSKAKKTFSATYCQCSCGWFRHLFETLLDRPVEVDLLGSIIQGDKNCHFLIRIQESG
jgi:predicted hydrocarbon binding protein